MYLLEICCTTAPSAIRTALAIGTVDHPHRELCFTYSGFGLLVYNALVAGPLRLSLLIAH